MSEFKFACPICGQHITCDSANSGTQMECPTCFRKLVVPGVTSGESSKFILSATQVPAKRPITEIAPAPTAAAASSRWMPWIYAGAVALVLAVAGFAAANFGGFKFSSRSEHVGSANVPAAGVSATESLWPVDPRWRLHLADVSIPAESASGRIKGKSFKLERATIQNGTLALRQGPGWPPDVGVTILLPKHVAADYAGKRFIIETNYIGPSPRVVLRTKDSQQKEVTQTIKAGYAMRLEFGAVAGNQLPGRIYLCTRDEAKSVVVGSFVAEIRKPGPPKPPKKPDVSPPATNQPTT